ncbi:MAG: hypothetical protein HAW62_01430 [Endozoicomonadaceae bacterium]|nr:hypothetical protein [Endozoicomonadaceae bacterium]
MKPIIQSHACCFDFYFELLHITEEAVDTSLASKKDHEHNTETSIMVVNPRSQLIVNSARFESKCIDRDPSNFFSSGIMSLRQHYSGKSKDKLTILDIYKDIENHDLISHYVLMCTQDNQSYIFYDTLDKYLIVLEKKPQTYKIRSFDFNPSAGLCQLDGVFDVLISPIPERDLQESNAFKSIDPIKEPEMPFARQAFILDHLINKDPNITHQDIDHESYQVMLHALRYANYRTLDDAEMDDLHIMAPGPVFTTWVSLTGISIFNGKNNPPRQLDFRSNLLDIANLLQTADIPLIIVYTELNMNPGEKEILISDFDHSNILIINTQELHVLKDLTDTLKKNKEKPILLLDDLRFNIIYDKQLFIEQAISIAKHQNKFNIVSSLEKTKKGSLVYTDADNILFKPPIYQLASRIQIMAVVLRSLDYLKKPMPPSHLFHILDFDTVALLEHESPFGSPLTVKIKTTELEKKQHHLSHAISTNMLDMKIAFMNREILLHQEIGYIRVDNHSLKHYTKPTYQELKLSIIQQNAWIYYARTESWKNKK